MGFARVSFLPTFGWEEKICISVVSVCEILLRYSGSAPMSKRIDMRCYADDYLAGR